VVEHLPKMCEILGSIPCIAKKKTKGKEKGERKGEKEI
jgi:hypothetical protein